MTDRDDDGELSFNVKEALSWLAAAHALRMVDEPLRLAILHPGGGMYDCLSLVDLDGTPRILMNRNGGSALSDGDLVTDIWDTAHGPDGPAILARQLLDRTTLATLDVDTFGPLGTTALGIGQWLGATEAAARSAHACWRDAAGYQSERDEDLLRQFLIPEAWRMQREPLPATDWSAWLYALTDDDQPIALINTSDGSAVTVDDEPWADWPALRVADVQSPPFRDVP